MNSTCETCVLKGRSPLLQSCREPHAITETSNVVLIALLLRAMCAEKCPPIRGRVFMSGFSYTFYAEGEESPEPRQQPQIYPRTHWPEKPGARPCIRPFPTGYEDDVAYYDAIVSEYPPDVLSPMPAYKSDSKESDPEYRTSKWPEHISVLYELLHETIPAKEWMDSLQIAELLSIISYGMNDYMAWLPYSFTIYGQATEDRPIAFPIIYHSGLRAAVSDGEIQPQYSEHWTAAELKRHIQGRRFIVVPVNDHDSHWLMSIFDREFGQLYVFDAVAHHRLERVQATAQIWARFWYYLDMPWHFTYYAAETTRQTGDYECGYLAIQWVVNMLRTDMGETMVREDESIETHDIWLGAYRTLDSHLKDEYPVDDTSIRVCDWVPSGRPTPETAVENVVDLLKLMVVNELGLWDNDHVNGESPRSRALHQLLLEDAPNWKWPSVSDAEELRIPSKNLQFVPPSIESPDQPESDPSADDDAFVRVALGCEELNQANDTEPVIWPGDECRLSELRRSSRGGQAGPSSGGHAGDKEEKREATEQCELRESDEFPTGEHDGADDETY